MSVITELEDIIREMKAGLYSEADGAVLITRDAQFGILTFNYPGLDNDEGHELMEDAIMSYNSCKRVVKQ